MGAPQRQTSIVPSTFTDRRFSMTMLLGAGTAEKKHPAPLPAAVARARQRILQEAALHPHTSPEKPVLDHRKWHGAAQQYLVLLQELLVAAGAPAASGVPDVKRLACMHGLLQELLQHAAFGGLQEVMEVVLPEVFLSTFSRRASAHPAPTTQRLLTPAAAEPVWHMPFFALWSNAEAELQHKQEQAEALQSAFSESQEIGAADREQRRALEDREATLTLQAADLTMERDRLEKQLSQAKAAAQATADQQWKLTRQAEDKIDRLKADVERLNRQVKQEKHQQQVHEQENALRDALRQVANDYAGKKQLTDEAQALEKQLALLLHSSLDNYERSLTEAGTGDAAQLRAAFISDAMGLMRQISALRDCTKVQQSRTHDVLEWAATALPASTSDAAQYQLPEQWDESARQACLRPDGSWRFGNMHQQLRLLWGMYARCYVSDYRPNAATARRMSCAAILEVAEACLARRSRHTGAVGKLSEEQPADFFFRFIEDRYGHGDVASLVAHGCIQALEQQAGTYAVLRMFVAILVGAVPEIVWHYTMQWRWLIARHPEHAQSAKTLVELLAPFASMDDKIEMAHRLPDTGGDPVAAVLDMFTLDLLKNNDLRHMRWREELDHQDLSPAAFMTWCNQTFSGLAPMVIQNAYQKFSAERKAVPDADSLAYIVCCLEAAEAVQG